MWSLWFIKGHQPWLKFLNSAWPSEWIAKIVGDQVNTMVHHDFYCCLLLLIDGGLWPCQIQIILASWAYEQLAGWPSTSGMDIIKKDESELWLWHWCVLYHYLSKLLTADTPTKRTDQVSNMTLNRYSKKLRGNSLLQTLPRMGS